jgi:hypothetical protein
MASIVDIDGFVGPKKKILFCITCRCTFSFSVRKQEQFKQNGWKDPRVCMDCKKEGCNCNYCQINKKSSY